MSEQDTQEVSTEVSTEVPESTIQANPELERATSQGWKPKEEYTGDPDKWVDYDEFNRRAPFFEAVSKANKKVKVLEEQLKTLYEHHNKTAEREYQRAREELLREKKLAAKDNDLEKVIAIDEQIEQLEQATPQKIDAPQGEHPAIVQFAEKNKWYVEDEVLQAAFNGYGAQIERLNPDMPAEEVLKRAKEKVEAAFPNKFSKAATSVTTSRHSPNGLSITKKKSLTYNDLPEEAKIIYKRLVKTTSNPYGIMSSEQYLKEYAANSGLNYEE